MISLCDFSAKAYLKVVPGAGIEPARHIMTRDFKSLASTNSATQAIFIIGPNYLRLTIKVHRLLSAHRSIVKKGRAFGA